VRIVTSGKSLYKIAKESYQLPATDHTGGGADAFIRDARLSPTKPISVLTFSTLYPNREMPYLGIFVENRLRRLLGSGEVASMVVAPVPWFPFEKRMFGRYGAFARVPREELRHGIPVLHPRYPLIPKLGMSSAPLLMYAGLTNALAEILKARFCFELIDAHYFYPDGVAAVLLGRSLGKPVVITARGTDISLVPHYRLARRWIRWAAQRADGIVAVSDALRTRLIELGVPGNRIEVLRNGVDLELFVPRDRGAARRQLSLNPSRPVLASVGRLIQLKGHDLAIRAAALLPEVTLLIVGEGPEDVALRRLAERTGTASRVHFLGSMPARRLTEVYNAADVVVLASTREGLPNVLLEALACGTPVVATAVWGTPEIVTTPSAGRLFQERSPEALARAIGDLLADPPARPDVRAHAERFGWGPTTAGQIRLFRSILGHSD
jgi:teichuronic acid biosynthesis glycosyltransferase TuaC